jgi:AcrR family transcriptional regulator
VTRHVDPASRSQLLERVVAYTLTTGVASLSLRSLAKELGISPGLLLYYFGSKEELTVEILKHAGERQRALFAELRTSNDGTAAEICAEVWRIIGAPEARPLFRLFFEVYGLALIDAKRFPNFFPAAISSWLDFLERPWISAGMNSNDARVKATIVLAGFRGFLLDICATGDRERVDRAVAAWIDSLF